MPLAIKSRRLEAYVQRRLAGRKAKQHEVRAERSVYVPVWNVKLAAWLDRLSAALVYKEPPLGQQGVRLIFEKHGISLGHPVYIVRSLKGKMYMGTLEYSNQWRRPRFKADAEAVFDQQCIAEIFAMMKTFK